MRDVKWGALLVAVLGCALAGASPAFAGAPFASGWFPHPADADWIYTWHDTSYNPVATDEDVTVKDQKPGAFTLAWTTKDQGNPDNAVQSAGLISFLENASGLFVTNWQATPPPPQFPILCASSAQCGNAMSSSLFTLIWGSRTPLLAEPLLNAATWTSVGGARSDVPSTSHVVGREKVTVPAFPGGVVAFKVRSTITQAGAIGDPYGTGVRDVWWVYGVGPVKIVFAHAGGKAAPVTSVVLRATNLMPTAVPPTADYFPLRKGAASTFRWTNSRYLKQPEVQRLTTEAVVNGSARIGVKYVSGPIKVAGAYGFTSRQDGIKNIWSLTRAASLAALPQLGPSTLAKNKRRHMFTPFDLMTFGFGPVLPEYPAAGMSWTAATRGRDWQAYGVTGTSKVIGVQKVKVPGGTFNALAVRSTLAQRGYPWGSGTRTSWFAPGKGLVKLVFRHGDGSVSNVELVK